MKLHGCAIKVEKVAGACGCGAMMDKYDKYHGRLRRYVNGHFRRGDAKIGREDVEPNC
jgi:cytochrome P450